MLNRRHLRIKVLQALYAFFRSGNDDLAVGEKELFHSINKIFDLYIWVLLLFGEINQLTLNKIEDGKNKRLPSPEDLNPNLKFANNAIFNLLLENDELLRHADSRKLNWVDERDELVKKMFRAIGASEEYQEYMANPAGGFDHDREFAVKAFKKYIANSELLQQHFEGQSIYWNDDFDLVCSMVIKTIKSFDAESSSSARLLSLFKDPEDETNFLKTLYRQTILSQEVHEGLIQEQAQNWETERIAVMDMLLMKMALTEAENFNTIPIKVSLNEYIEISKFYSTPKSSVFINGILDKLFQQLKESGKIKKVGRGLIG